MWNELEKGSRIIRVDGKEMLYFFPSNKIVLVFDIDSLLGWYDTWTRNNLQKTARSLPSFQGKVLGWAAVQESAETLLENWHPYEYQKIYACLARAPSSVLEPIHSLRGPTTLLVLDDWSPTHRAETEGQSELIMLKDGLGWNRHFWRTQDTDSVPWTCKEGVWKHRDRAASRVNELVPR